LCFPTLAQGDGTYAGPAAQSLSNGGPRIVFDPRLTFSYAGLKL